MVGLPRFMASSASAFARSWRGPWAGRALRATKKRGHPARGGRSDGSRPAHRRLRSERTPTTAKIAASLFEREACARSSADRAGGFGPDRPMRCGVSARSRAKAAESYPLSRTRLGAGVSGGAGAARTALSSVRRSRHGYCRQARRLRLYLPTGTRRGRHSGASGRDSPAAGTGSRVPTIQPPGLPVALDR